MTSNNSSNERISAEKLADLIRDGDRFIPDGVRAWFDSDESALLLALKELSNRRSFSANPSASETKAQWTCSCGHTNAATVTLKVTHCSKCEAVRSTQETSKKPRLRDSDAAFNMGVLPTEQPEKATAYSPSNSR